MLQGKGCHSPRCWCLVSSCTWLCWCVLVVRVLLWGCDTFGSSSAVVVQMTRVKVAACSQYSTCTECLAAADAYCGWCTMETR